MAEQSPCKRQTRVQIPTAAPIRAPWCNGSTAAIFKRKGRGFDTRGANMGRRERAGSSPARPTRNKKKGEMSIDQKENDSGGEAGASRQEKRGS